MSTGSDEGYKRLVRKEFWGGLRSLLIGGLILAVIWGILGWFVPEGWPMLIVNIICLLLSLGFGMTVVSHLRQRLSLWLSGFIAGLLWVLIFGIIRGLF